MKENELKLELEQINLAFRQCFEGLSKRFNASRKHIKVDVKVSALGSFSIKLCDTGNGFIYPLTIGELITPEMIAAGLNESNLKFFFKSKSFNQSPQIIDFIPHRFILSYSKKHNCVVVKIIINKVTVFKYWMTKTFTEILAKAEFLNKAL